MIILFDENDVVSKSRMEDYTKKYLLLKPDSLRATYRSAKFQLFYAGGGFGCVPDKLGSAVFGYFCADGETTRFERSSFMGIATDEAAEEWKNMYGDIVLPTD